MLNLNLRKPLPPPPAIKVAESVYKVPFGFLGTHLLQRPLTAWNLFTRYLRLLLPVWIAALMIVGHHGHLAARDLRARWPLPMAHLRWIFSAAAPRSKTFLGMVDAHQLPRCRMTRLSNILWALLTQQSAALLCAVSNTKLFKADFRRHHIFITIFLWNPLRINLRILRAVHTLKIGGIQRLIRWSVCKQERWLGAEFAFRLSLQQSLFCIKTLIFRIKQISPRSTRPNPLLAPPELLVPLSLFNWILQFDW